MRTESEPEILHVILMRYYALIRRLQPTHQ